MSRTNPEQLRVRCPIGNTKEQLYEECKGCPYGGVELLLGETLARDVVCSRCNIPTIQVLIEDVMAKSKSESRRPSTAHDGGCDPVDSFKAGHTANLVISSNGGWEEARTEDKQNQTIARLNTDVSVVLLGDAHECTAAVPRVGNHCSVVLVMQTHHTNSATE